MWYATQPEKENKTKNKTVINMVAVRQKVELKGD